MSAIKVNLDGLDSSAMQIKTVAMTLDDLKSSMNGVFSSIDPKIKCRRNIDGSIADIQKKMQMLYTEMNDLSRFISFSKDKYANMEACIAALSEDFRNQIKNQAENDIPWWQTNAFKLTVGMVVTGTAIGLAVIFGGPILIGAAVGAVIGAGIGGVTAGLASIKNGGTFIDGFSDGYMWGSIGGAVSGAIGGTGVGLVGGSLAQGAVNSGTYVGETLQNGGKVSTMGVVGSFGTGAVFYAVGTVAFGKLTEYIKARPTGNVLNEAKVAGNPEAVGKETEILAKEVSNVGEGGLDTSAYHAVDEGWKAQSVLDDIDISYTSPESRFGQGFYVAAEGDTTVAELAYHGADAKYAIRYDMDLTGQSVLDLTNPEIAAKRGYVQQQSTLLECQSIADRALTEGYNVIKVQSYRSDGINYILYDNFDDILTPQMVTPIRGD